MELCVKCFFDNKSEFEKALNYLETTIGSSNMAYSGRDVELDPNGNSYIETYGPITQNQLNELTALCPIRPKRDTTKVTKEMVYNRIAYLIGRFGAAYHPDDDVRDLAPDDIDYIELVHLELVQNDIDFGCDVLGLDPCAIALEIATSLGIIPEHIK